jgi:hypothetical protein
MTERCYPLAIRVTAATKLALERAAAADSLSVAAYIEAVLARVLAEGGCGAWVDKV